MAKKVIKEEKIDYERETELLLERLYTKSDVYGGRDKVVAEKQFDISGKFMEADEYQQISDMMPADTLPEEDDLGEESMEYSPEDMDFLNGIRVYKVNDSVQTEEEIEEIKHTIEEKLEAAEFEINYKWIEFDRKKEEEHVEEEFNDEGLPAETEVTDDEDSIVESLEDEEETEQSETNTYLIVYDGDVLDEELEKPDFEDLKEFMGANLEKVDILQDDYDFVRDELLSKKEEAPKAENEEENKPTEEATPEEAEAPAEEEAPKIEESKKVEKEDKTVVKETEIPQAAPATTATPEADKEKTPEEIEAEKKAEEEAKAKGTAPTTESEEKNELEQKIVEALKARKIAEPKPVIEEAVQKVEPTKVVTEISDEDKIKRIKALKEKIAEKKALQEKQAKKVAPVVAEKKETVIADTQDKEIDEKIKTIQEKIARKKRIQKIRESRSK